MPIILYTDIEKLKKLYKLHQHEAAVAGPNLEYVQPANVHMSTSPMISPVWTHAAGGPRSGAPHSPWTKQSSVARDTWPTAHTM